MTTLFLYETRSLQLRVPSTLGRPSVDFSVVTLYAGSKSIGECDELENRWFVTHADRDPATNVPQPNDGGPGVSRPLSERVVVKAECLSGWRGDGCTVNRGEFRISLDNCRPL
jgi:hypothetical protein